MLTIIGFSPEFVCHPEQAFFAQRRIWASRAMRRAFCDAILARLARLLIVLSSQKAKAAIFAIAAPG
jgi:hypothetical protein